MMDGTPQQPQSRLYVTPAEMAQLTGLHIRTIRQAIAAGEMPALRMGRGRSGAMHVRREVFERWLLQKEQARGQEA